MVFLSDWDHKTAFQSWKTDADWTFDPELENVLINYKNVWDCDVNTTLSVAGDPKCLGSGIREEFVFEKGKTYKMHLINTAIDGWFEFSMDKHTFSVVAADLVPIVPYETSSLSISMAQRYDIIFTADAAVGDYWMRAGWVNYCAINIMY
jgi:FtsP/CotA-like multicopper oxidase with cupredoxin domain